MRDGTAKTNFYVGLLFVAVGILFAIAISPIVGSIVAVLGALIVLFSVLGYADTRSALKGEKMPPDQRL